MKSILTSKYLQLMVAAVVFCLPAVHAGTIATTFSFQKGDLRQDGALYGSGAAYSGVLDGHIADINPTSLVSTGTTLTIGNQFQTGTANGRNFDGLFSYDLTELYTYITNNTSANSSVAVISVSLKLVATGGSSTVAGQINLYRTDPFTSGATWPTNGTGAWSVPYQNLTNKRRNTTTPAAVRR